MYIGPSVFVPYYEIVIEWSGYNLGFVCNGNCYASNSCSMTHEHLKRTILLFFIKIIYRFTWDSFPPLTCQTFSDMSLDPVIINWESIVKTKHVISLEWLTTYFSSPLVAQILSVVSPFEATWRNIEQFWLFLFYQDILTMYFMVFVTLIHLFGPWYDCKTLLFSEFHTKILSFLSLDRTLTESMKM